MNPFRKRDQSEPVKATYVQPIASDASDSNSLDSSLEAETQPMVIQARQEQAQAVAQASVHHDEIINLARRHRLLRYSMLAALLLIGTSLLIVRLNSHSNKPVVNSVDQQYSSQKLELSGIAKNTSKGASTKDSVNVNGQLNVNNTLVLSPSKQPNTAVAGQLYYDAESGELKFYNGDSYNTLPTSNNVVTSLGGSTGSIGIGSGLGLIGNQLVSTGINTITAGDNVAVSDDGAGNLTISSQASGSVSSPNGTAGRLAKFTGSQSIADSLIGESGSTVTVNGGLHVTGNLTLSSALSVSQGGTGLQTLNANQILFASSANTIGQLSNGSAGQCFVSNGAGLAPSFQSCAPASASVASLNGQTGVVTLSNASGASGTVTINDAAADGSTKGIASFSGSNFAATSGNVSIKAGGVTSTEIADGTIANTDLAGGTYTSVTGTGTLAAGSIASGFGTIVTTNTITGTTVNGTTGINTGAGAGTQRIDVSGNLTNIGTINTSGLITGSNGLTISAGTVTLSGLSGGSSTCLTLDASSHVGTATCATGSGSTPTLQNVYDNSGATPNIVLTTTGNGVNIQDATTPIGGNLLAVKNNAGTVTYFNVTSAGIGVTGSVTATSFAGDGTSVTNVDAAKLGGNNSAFYTNASNVSSGTLNDSRLSANVALYNAATANFTGNLQHNGNAVCDMSGNCNGVAGGAISGGGTLNKIPIFTGSGYTVGDSVLSQNVGATVVTVTGNLSVTGSVTATSFAGDGTSVTNVDAAKLGGNNSAFYTNASNLSSGTVVNGRLSGSYTSVTGTGTLAAGSIASGFGTIVTTNTITGTTVNGTTGINTGAGAGTQRIDVSGNLTNIGTINTSGLITGSNGLTISAGTVTLSGLSGGSSTCLTLDASSHVGTATCATGSGSTPTLQNVYDNSGATPNILLASLGKGVSIQDAAVSVGGNLLAIKNNAGNVTYLGVTSTGASINGNLSATGSVTFSSLGTGVAVLTSGVLTSASINLGSLPAYISGTLPVGNGGTGASAFGSTNGVIYYDGSKLASGNAGTTGQCLLATTGSAPSFGTCTGAGGVSSVTATTTQTGALVFNGTPNQVSVTNSSTTFTFSTPQSIATSSDVQFNSVNATTLLKTNGTTRVDASGNLSNIGTVTASGLISTSGGLTVSGGTVTLSNLTGGSSTCLTLDASNHVGAATCATGGGSTPTLQNVYDNSNTAPNILLSSTGNGVTIQDATSSIGGNLLSVKNNSGSTTYFGVTTGGADITGSLSVSSNVTLSSLTGGVAAGKCLTTDGAGKLQLTSCLSGGSGGGGGVSSLNGLSGGITLNNATISSQNIIIDDASTAQKGLASFSSGNFTVTSGNVSIKTGGVTTTEILDGTVANADLAGGTYASITGTGALAAGSITSGFGTIATASTITGTSLNGTAGINTGAGGGIQRINASGNLVNIGTINTSGLITSGNGLTVSSGTITFDNLSGGSGQCLTLDASHIVGVSTCATGTGTTPTLQNVYDNSTTSPDIILTATGGGLVIQDAGTTVGNLLSVSNSGNGIKYFNVTATGTTATGTITFNSLASATGGVVFANAGGSLSVTSSAGTAGECLLSNGSGNAPSFTTCPGNGALPTNGSATDNRISKFSNSATKLTDSQISDDGTHVSVGGTGTTGGQFNVGTTDQFQVSGAGAVTAVGVNSGAGLLQGSAGLTISGGNVTLSSLSAGSGSCLALDGSNHLVTSSCAAGTGSGNYIQNQNGAAQSTAVFWISGAGRSNTSFLAPAFDTATGAALDIGTSNATSVAIGKVGVTTTINGPLTSTGLITGNAGINTSGGAFTIASNAASSLSTTNGTLGVQGAGAVTVSTTNNTVSAGITIKTGNSSSGTAGTVLIDTGTSSTGTSIVNIGTTNAGSVVLGNGTSTISANSSISVAANKNLSLTSGTGTFSQAYVNNSGSAQTIGSTNTSTVGGTVSAITINAAGTNATGSNTVNALSFGNASNGSGGTTTFNGLSFGTGYSNLLTSANTTITGAGGLALGGGSNTGTASITNSTATTTLNISSSASPTTALIVVNDTSGTGSDKLISLQASGTPKFTVDATGNVIALGTYNTNTFTSNTLTFGAGSAATISSSGTNALNLDTGAAAALNLGIVNANAVSISKAGANTTINGSATISQLLTANTGLTIASGSTFTNASSTLIGTVALGNLATGPIGANTATVDISTAFTINPLAAGRSYTLPIPTNAAAGRIVYVSNISGTFGFTITGVTVPAGANAGFLWNGSTWAASNVSTGASVVGSLNGGTANATGATITGNTLYLQSASATFAGIVDTANGQVFAGTKSFSSLLTAGAGFTASNGPISLTGNAASSFTTTSGTLTLTSAAAATWGTSAGDLTVQANGTSNLNLNTSGAGTVNIGTIGSINTNSTVHIADSTAAIQVVTIGSTSNTSSTLIQGGSGTTAGSEAIRIIPGAAGAVTIGGTSQTGGINVGVSSLSNTINIGNNTISAGNTQTVNIATSSTGSGNDIVTIGSLNDGSTTTLQAGTGGIVNSLASNASNAFIIQNTAQSLSSTGQFMTFSAANSATNLLNNPGFENNPITAWAADGSAATPVRDTTQSYNGAASGKVVTTATTGDGIKQNLGALSGTYTVSFYAKLDAASAAMNNDLLFGIYNGSNETTYVSPVQTTPLSSTGWTRYSATFSGVSTTGTPYFFAKQSDAVAHTFYIDQIQVEAGSNSSGQGIGSAQFNSIIASPLTLQNTVNSTNAFSVFDASGNIVFSIDTLNRRVNVGAGVNFLATHTKYITLTPEYTGAVLDATSDATCSAANNGTMTSGFDAASSKQTYYQWVSGLASNQCYDVIVSVPVPADFASWTGGPTIAASSAGGAPGSNSICLQILNTAGATDTAYGSYSCATPGTSLANLSAFTAPTSTYNATAGNTMTLKIRLVSSGTTNLTQLGNISIPYLSSY